MVDVAQLTGRDLLARKAVLDAHLEVCCGTQDGTCRLLTEVGEIQYLLGKPEVIRV